FDGPGTFQIRSTQEEVARSIPIDNIPTQGTLWVELWYRTHIGDTGPGSHVRYISPRVFGVQNQYMGEERVYLARTFGAWRKMTFQMNAPRTPGGRVEIRARCGAELLEIDAVEIKHVSDDLNNSLRRF